MKKEKRSKITTHGPYSPGEVHGDYIIHLHNAQIPTAAHNAENTPQKQLSDKNNKGHDINKLGPMGELYRLSPNETYKEKLYVEWEKISNLGTPTPYETAILTRRILPDTISLNLWPIRRTLAHVAGHAYNELSEDRNLQREIGETYEVASESHEGKIFLSSALSRLDYLPKDIAPYINKLLKEAHPQISWEIINKYHITPLLTADATAKESVLEKNEDPWIRRSILASLAVWISEHPSELDENIKSFASGLKTIELKMGENPI